ncbi:MAG TPA: ABC-type transport auxiliary lipoprotein family protein [Polyangia bacterium]|jgi:hypothetical protein
MKVTANRARLAAALLGGLAVAPACLRKAEVRYYTLAGAAPARAVRAAPVAYTVHVAAASVPEALDRPEMVLRLSDTEVAVDDHHRWAEPLRTGIARAVADGLARALDGALVSASEQQTAQPSSDVELTMDVRRLDVSLADGIALDIAWRARWANNGPTRAGRSTIHQRGRQPGGYDGAVAACAAALDAVAGEIARSVRLEVLSRR